MKELILTPIESDNLRHLLDLVCEATNGLISEEGRMGAATDIAMLENLNPTFQGIRERVRTIANNRTDNELRYKTPKRTRQ